MATVAIIGGTGAQLFPAAADAIEIQHNTRWGLPSAPLLSWEQAGHSVLFLRRHGIDGGIPPHAVNYRSNIAALADLNADYVIALNAVGGIAAWMNSGQLAIPDQIIDYTWGREHSIHPDSGQPPEFVDFTLPYDEQTRQQLLAAALNSSLEVVPAATYAAMQGPRLESAAEIDRLERDGCHLVGMTGMPEAGLARELGLRYASCCIIVNQAAGRGDSGIHTEIEAHITQGMEAAAQLLDGFLDLI